MTETLVTLFGKFAYASLFVFFASFAPAQFIHWRFLNRLRALHSELWAALGRPNFWTERTVWDSWPHVKFLLDREFERLENREARQFCEAYRQPIVIAFFTLTLSALSMIGFFALVVLFSFI